MKKRIIQTFRIKDMLDFRTLKSKEQIKREEIHEKKLKATIRDNKPRARR